MYGLDGDDELAFGDGGDAGAGDDDCTWAFEVENCEVQMHFDPPALPFVSEPRQGAELEADAFSAITGGIAGGLGGPRDPRSVLVALRLLGPEGCSWWDARRGSMEVAACARPSWNGPDFSTDDRWTLPLRAGLPTGLYEARARWRRFSDITCVGAFAPMCVSFSLR